MNNIYHFPCPKTFNLSLCLDCGQAFRWTKNGNMWTGVAHGKYIEIEQTDSEIVFHNCTEDDFKKIWVNYFDLDCDYEKIVTSYDDEHLRTAVKEYDGIRILRQEPWEALCSFIISQNNNIPRISKLIETISERYGEKIETDDGIKYAFPSAKRLAQVTVEELESLKLGYRAKYIADAANRVANGVLDLESVSKDNAREELPVADDDASDTVVIH